MIIIVDNGLGNNGSVNNMFKRIGVDSKISSNIEELRSAEKIVLPGVGTFDEGMIQLEKNQLRSVLNELVLEKKIPVLGICLGMQLFVESSEEGTLPGLGWIKGNCLRFKENLDVKVPHMGWNFLTVNKECRLFDIEVESERFYFVHSYHVVPSNEDVIATTCNHGIDFVSSIEHKNIYATQFHPEKSHKFGMRLLKRFASL